MPRAAKNTPRPFKRTGLHRLECPSCDGYAYATVAQLEKNLEKHGRLLLCACGEPMDAERLELAMTLGLSHPLELELSHRTQMKLKGQRPHAYKPCTFSGDLASYGDLEMRALNEIRLEESAGARDRRLTAIKPVPEPLPF